MRLKINCCIDCSTKDGNDYSLTEVWNLLEIGDQEKAGTLFTLSPWPHIVLFFYIFTPFNKNSALYLRLEWLFVLPKKSLLVKK